MLSSTEDGSMTEGYKGWSSILMPALVSAAAVVGVGLLTYFSNKDASALKAQEVALAQNRFDADERKRFEETVSRLVPHFFEEDQQKQDAALATLLALYPDRVQEIVAAIKSASSGKATVELQSAVDRVAAIPTQDSNWYIVVGGDKTAASAASEVDKARKLGYSTALFLRDSWYRTTVGPFPSRMDAERENIAVRQSIGRGSYIVNIATWCPKPRQGKEAIECAWNKVDK